MCFCTHSCKCVFVVGKLRVHFGKSAIESGKWAGSSIVACFDKTSVSVCKYTAYAYIYNGLQFDCCRLIAKNLNDAELRLSLYWVRENKGVCLALHCSCVTIRDQSLGHGRGVRIRCALINSSNLQRVNWFRGQSDRGSRTNRSSVQWKSDLLHQRDSSSSL